MKSKRKEWMGSFDFKENRRVGNGVLIDNGIEYFVKYDNNGKEISRKGIYDGIRLMIIGNRFFFL